MTTADRERVVDEAIAETIEVHGRVRRESRAALLAAADALLTAFGAGRKVLVCGNGGSAADAQHFAAELVGRFVRERRAWPTLALTTDTSIVTAVGNDYGFERVFARQVEAHGQTGDVLGGISTSGGLGRVVDVHLNVPSTSTARTQEVHITLLHVLCDLVEQELVAADA
jgi:D-sedoheptulose 7-phosphate isomerase